MKIDISHITEEGVTLTETIPAKDWDLDGFDIEVTGQIALTAEFTKIGKEILVRGTAQLDTMITCDRCQETVAQPLTHEFTLSYASTEVSDPLVIDSDVREDILLEYPMKVLCNPDCKGICSDCGVNLNIDRCKCCKKPNRR